MEHPQLFNHLPQRLAIIGGGPIGVGIAKALSLDQFDFDIIEKEATFGGLWNIESPEARRVYQSAHLISCKSITQLSDFPMPKEYPHYPNHRLMVNYIRSIATHYNLEKNTLFNTLLVGLSINENGSCELTFHTGEKRTYGGVIIANGLLNKPLFPYYPGSFSGKIIHSLEYIDPFIFKNKRVLVVGSGNSGCDIATELCRFCDKLVQSTRRAYYYMPKFIHGMPTQEWMMKLASECSEQDVYWDEVMRQFKMAGYDPCDYGLPKPAFPIYACHPIMNSQMLYYVGHGDIFHKPDIQRFDKNTVYFTDGTYDDFDVIIFATGFRPEFPFLDTKQFNQENIFKDTFIRSFDKRHPNIIFSGYFNSPSGLGNLLNFGGRLNSLYFQAMFNNPEVFNKLLTLTHGSEPDLGNGVFIDSDRHRYEFDLWKTSSFMAKLIQKLEREMA